MAKITPTYSKEDIDKNREKIYESVDFSELKHSCTLQESFTKINEALAKYGEDARLDISGYIGYYDEIEVEIRIEYNRDETDNEVIKKLKYRDKAKDLAKKNREKYKKENFESFKKRAAKLTKKEKLEILKEMGIEDVKLD